MADLTVNGTNGNLYTFEREDSVKTGATQESSIFMVKQDSSEKPSSQGKDILFELNQIQSNNDIRIKFLKNMNTTEADYVRILIEEESASIHILLNSVTSGNLDEAEYKYLYDNIKYCENNIKNYVKIDNNGKAELKNEYSIKFQNVLEEQDILNEVNLSSDEVMNELNLINLKNIQRQEIFNRFPSGNSRIERFYIRSETRYINEISDGVKSGKQINVYLYNEIKALEKLLNEEMLYFETYDTAKISKSLDTNLKIGNNINEQFVQIKSKLDMK